MRKKIIGSVIGLTMLITSAIPAIAEKVNVYQNQKIEKRSFKLVVPNIS